MSPTTPVAYPTVVIDGQEFTLKLDKSALFYCSQRSFSLNRKLGEILDQSDPMAFYNTLVLFGACISHNFVAKGKTPPSPEEWAYKIPDDQLSAFSKKLGEALGKAAAANAPETPKTNEPGQQS